MFGTIAFLFISCTSDKLLEINQVPNISISSRDSIQNLDDGLPILLEVMVSDKDHDISDLMVYWRTNNGEICPPTLPDDLGQAFCNYTPQTEDLWISVQVIDPEGAVSEDSVDVYINTNKRPNVSLLSPTSGELYVEGLELPFEGFVSDDLDAPSDIEYHWYSNIDGHLAIQNKKPQSSGYTSDLSLLSAGLHTITFEAIDTEGLKTTESVDIQVQRVNQVPDCSILAPVENEIIIANEPVLLQGLAIDSDSDNNELSVIWKSNIEGELGSESPFDSGFVQSITNLVSGTHMITLEVEDEEGALCLDNISVLVDSRPTVEILYPLSTENFDIGQLINFQALVDDFEDDKESLYITWTSNLDGVISTQSSDSNGFVAFDVDSLSHGFHIINVQVEDSAGLIDSETIEVQVGNIICDPNPPGTLHIPENAFCDPNPPIGWTQCAGWINTDEDDVSNSIFDGCLNDQNRLWIRVWDQSTGILEEEIYSVTNDISQWVEWGYLYENSYTHTLYRLVTTNWTGNTNFFTTTDGTSACTMTCGVDAPCGTLTLGTGYGDSLIFAPGWDNEYEIRISCSGAPLNNKIVAFYN